VLFYDVEDLGLDKNLVAQQSRVRLYYDVAEPLAPRTLIAKHAAVADHLEAGRSREGLFEREVRFYQKLATQLILATPRCYYARRDPASGRHLLLLEELGPADPETARQGCSMKEASLLVREIARFHAGWWQRPELGRLSWIPDHNQSRHTDQMQQRFPQILAAFKTMGTGELPPGLLEMAERAGGQLAALAHDLYDASPRTLVHGDLGRENLAFSSSRNDLGVAVANWQGLGKDAGVTDAALFIGEHLNSEVRPAEVRKLLAIYQQGLQANGVDDLPYERCLLDFRRALLLRQLKLIELSVHSPLPVQQREQLREIALRRNFTTINLFDAASVLHLSRA
jgi:hypothetical protein